MCSKSAVQRAEYLEEDRIEHIHGFSHCRCRNKLVNSNNSCSRYRKTVSIKMRKTDLPEDQQCHYNSNTGYCRLSRIDEIDLIKRTDPKKLHLIVDQIVTERGVKFFKSLYRDMA